MNIVTNFYRSTVGKKAIMAVTGLILVGFVIGHMIGNLKAFSGTGATGIPALDEYALYLRTMGQDLFGHGGVLWLVRAVLLLAVVLHITSAVQLKRLNIAARPIGYQTPRRYRSATLSSRTMFWGGLLLLVFIVFHILHLTTGTLHTYGFEEGKVLWNVITAFQNPFIMLFYIAAMGALMLHLYHGTWSAFQSLGLDKPASNKALRSIAKVVAILLFFGFCSVPVAVFLGVLQLPMAAH